MRSARTAAFLAAILWSVATGVARPGPAGTDCPFGGPTPGWAAIRLELPSGTEFLTLELGGARAARPVYDDENWHLAQGVLVLDADTLALEAYRVGSQGMAPRRVVLRAGGTTAAAQSVAAPDVPYEHAAARLRDGLPPGNYLAIAFGTDGGRALQNEWWSAGVQVSGDHRCTPIGQGETFDHDHTDFGGGTQVYAPGAGYGEGLSHAFSTTRRIVVGLLDAETQARAASSVSLTYETPTTAEPITISQKLVPFVSTAGDYRFEGSFRGVYPVLLVAGVAVDIG